MYQNIHRDRLYQQIVKQIENLILTGELHIGDRLPSERQLAERFDVSRTSVREAVRALQEKGLVEAFPGKGTFITNSTSQAMRASLSLMLGFECVDSGILDLVEVREILEPEIAYFAALHACPEDIDLMREAIEKMDKAINQVEVFIQNDQAFHCALARAARNSLLVALIDPIVDLLQEQRKRIFEVEGGAERGQYHHRRILDAIAKHDAEQARDAMRAHLQQIREDSQISLPARERRGA